MARISRIVNRSLPIAVTIIKFVILNYYAGQSRFSIVTVDYYPVKMYVKKLKYKISIF